MSGQDTYKVGHGHMFGKLAGLNLPVRGQAVWKLPSGDLPYADVELKEVDYNGPVESF